MTRDEVLRRRRCIALRLAVFFGLIVVLINARETSWPLIGIALAGIALALVSYRRNCRTSRDAS